MSRSLSEEVTLADADTEHVRVVREGSVSERIDPRISPQEIADEEELDTPYLRQLSDYVHHNHHHHAESTDVEQGTTSEKGSDTGPLYVRSFILRVVRQLFMSVFVGRI